MSNPLLVFAIAVLPAAAGVLLAQAVEPEMTVDVMGRLYVADSPNEQVQENATDRSAVLPESRRQPDTGTNALPTTARVST